MLLSSVLSDCTPSPTSIAQRFAMTPCGPVGAGAGTIAGAGGGGGAGAGVVGSAGCALATPEIAITAAATTRRMPRLYARRVRSVGEKRAEHVEQALRALLALVRVVVAVEERAMFGHRQLRAVLAG